MITLKTFVKATEFAIPFGGDTTKTWYVEVFGSNIPNPEILGFAHGSVTLKFKPEALNYDVTLNFYTASEEGLSKSVDEAITQKNNVALLATKAKAWIAETIRTSPRLLALIISVALGFVIIERVFPPEGDPHKYREGWKNISAAGVADWMDELYDNRDEIKMVGMNAHPIYDSYAIKEIEERFVDQDGENKLSFRAMFKYTGKEIFVMKDLIENDGDPILMDHDSAQNYCSMIETSVAEESILKEVFPHLGVKERDEVAEWGAESNGWFSDDYAVFVKDADIPDGAYKRDGRFFVDGDDVKLGARCMFRASDFEG